VYVWFDALINYASAVGLGGDADAFRKWWPADLHVIGKDITRFHTVIWPAMLMSAKLPLPRQVFGHGFMTVGGQRMSKSLGTIIDPVAAADRHGADPLRLYLAKEITFGGDGDFSWERYDERYNVDLANNLGNLVSRVTAMAERYRQARLVPTRGASDTLARMGEQAGKSYRRSMEVFAIHEGAAAAFRLIDAANEFIAETAPWALARDPSQDARLGQVLFDAAEAVRLAAVMLMPFMPASSAEILRRIGAGGAALRLDRDGAWRAEGERRIVNEGHLWPRAETKERIVVSDQAMQGPGPTPERSGSDSKPLAPGPDEGRISIDDFMKIDLRVAKVLAAERVPKSNKLLKLQIDAGSEQRTVVAGIAEAYEPDALIGRTVVVVLNLRSTKLMGIESNGMVLAASPEGGKPALVGFEIPPPPGVRVR
jgi:methionyl-tRNA synthetase